MESITNQVRYGYKSRSLHVI